MTIDNRNRYPNEPWENSLGDTEELTSSGVISVLKLGEIVSRDNIRITAELQLDINDPLVVDPRWHLVMEGFEELNNKSLLRQAPTKDEFVSDLANEGVLKYIASDVESGELEGFLTVHTDLRDIIWADQNKLREIQDSVGEGSSSFYVGTTVVSKDKRQTELSYLLLSSALDQYVELSKLQHGTSVCFFDRADKGHKGLSALVQRKLNSLSDQDIGFNVQEIDTRRYVTYGAGNAPVSSVDLEGPIIITEEDNKYRVTDPKTGKDYWFSQVSKEDRDYLLLNSVRLSYGNLDGATKKIVDYMSYYAQTLSSAVALEVIDVDEINFPHELLDTQHYYAIFPYVKRSPDESSVD
jgi:hypothetical protein